MTISGIRPIVPTSTPGRARTDTCALLGGSPLPLGYGGAKIVPQLVLFIQTFLWNRAGDSSQIDIGRLEQLVQLHLQFGHCYYTSRAVTHAWPGCYRDRYQAIPATLRARSKTASSMVPVTRPVNVFC